MLIAGLWGPLKWIHWMQLVGTTARVLVGYCLLARTLSLAPWNRRQPLSWTVAARTFLSLQTGVPPCSELFRGRRLDRVRSMNWEAFCRNADRLLFRQLITNYHYKGGCAMSQVTMSGVVNGVDVEKLGGTMHAVQQDPSLAAFQFRATNQWINGGHNRSTVQSFYGAGQEDRIRTKPFVLEADEPPVLLGDDHGANPVEYVLHALAACLTTSLVYHAAARGIRIESVESKLEGDL